jgi:hypothetical protein
VSGCSDDTGWLGGYPGLIREYRQSVERRKREKKEEETTGSMPGGEVEGWKESTTSDTGSERQNEMKKNGRHSLEDCSRWIKRGKKMSDKEKKRKEKEKNSKSLEMKG